MPAGSGEKCGACGKPRKLEEWHPLGHFGKEAMRVCAACKREDRAKRSKASEDNGGAQPGAGRPASADPRDSKVLLAFTSSEMAEVTKAAKEAGEKPAAFGRTATLERAHEVLGTHKSK